MKSDVAGDSNNRRSKDLGDYFPATWLALLTILDLDNPSLWEHKLTSADYIPSEFPAVPAYGSIVDLVVLAAAATGGDGIIAISNDLPIVHGPGFELRFRHHPLLGLIGVFETYSTLPIKGIQPTPTLLVNATLNWQGYMGFELNLPSFEIATSYDFRMSELSRYALEWLRKDCTGGDEPTWPPCLNNFDMSWTGTLVTQGPLYLMIADRLEHPFIFPHRMANHREKLLGLIIQSPFWPLTDTGYAELVLNRSETSLKKEERIAARAIAWAAEEGREDGSTTLELSDGVYANCSAFLAGTSVIEDYQELGDEVRKIDSWVDANGLAAAACRKATLALFAAIIYVLVDEWGRVWPLGAFTFAKGKLKSPEVEGYAAALSQYLTSRSNTPDVRQFHPIKKEVLPSLREISQSWSVIEELCRWGGKLSDEHQHPLDDLLIYRTILVEMIYSQGVDSSDFLNVESESYHLTIPIL